MTISVKEALDWLYGTQLFGIKLGLKSARRLADVLGVPAEKQRIVHVAGTNGKGSVSAMIAAICRAAGHRTGLFTSPHLVHFGERIRVNGISISPEEIAAGLERLRVLVADWDPHPTFFELTLALALDHFRTADCEVLVLETGMGGRLDATNAFDPVVSVLTPIGLDHRQWLGNTLAEIAVEKAGIIKPRVPVVSAAQSPDAMRVIDQVARENQAPLELVDAPWEASPLALAGAHQRENAALAVAAVRAAGIEADEPALRDGLASVAWPARFDIRALKGNHELVIDGAHNPHAAAALAATWRERYGDATARVVFGAVESKDMRGVLQALEPLAESFAFTGFNSPRALPPESLAAMTTVRSECFDSPVAALESCGDAARVLVTGSLFLAGQVLAQLDDAADAYESSTQ